MLPKLTRKQRRAIDRTKRGVCSRCGTPPDSHPLPDLPCPDGGGCYSWAYSAGEKRALIERIEKMQADHERQRATQPPLTDEQQRMLVELQRGVGATGAVALLTGVRDAVPGPNSTVLASRLGWSDERVRRVGHELAVLGLVGLKSATVN